MLSNHGIWQNELRNAASLRSDCSRFTDVDPSYEAQLLTAKGEAEEGLAASDVQTRGPIQRALLLTSGALLTMVAVIGLFLPILPTTPFLILAAGCFARSSPAMYRALLANKSFGHLLAQWQSNRSIPAGAKVKAYSLILVSFSISIYLVEPVGLRLILGCLGAALLLFLKRIPSATRQD